MQMYISLWSLNSSSAWKISEPILEFCITPRYFLNLHQVCVPSSLNNASDGERESSNADTGSAELRRKAAMLPLSSELVIAIGLILGYNNLYRTGNVDFQASGK